MDLGMIDTHGVVHRRGARPAAARSPPACLYVHSLQLALGRDRATTHRMTLGHRPSSRGLSATCAETSLPAPRNAARRSFYDRVAVGRVMTRVTNDVEALYELLRGHGQP